MKQFVFDRLVDADNICNLRREQRALRAAVRHGHRVVVYGPHNYGKTSVVRNVTIEEFRRTRKRHFVLFADLMGVRSMQSLTRRLATSLQRSFAASFPAKGFLESVGRFLAALRPEISLDPQTGNPSLSLHARGRDLGPGSEALWEHIARIAEEVDSLIVLDEFQDVALVPEAPAQLRACLEALGAVPDGSSGGEAAARPRSDRAAGGPLSSGRPAARRLPAPLPVAGRAPGSAPGPFDRRRARQ